MPKTEKLLPIHPGEILREDCMRPLGIRMNRVAMELRVPVTRVAEIVHQREASLPTRPCVRGALSTPARFWMNAQSIYDLEVA